MPSIKLTNKLRDDILDNAMSMYNKQIHDAEGDIDPDLPLRVYDHVMAPFHHYLDHLPVGFTQPASTIVLSNETTVKAGECAVKGSKYHVSPFGLVETDEAYVSGSRYGTCYIKLKDVPTVEYFNEEINVWHNRIEAVLTQRNELVDELGVLLASCTTVNAAVKKFTGVKNFLDDDTRNKLDPKQADVRRLTGALAAARLK